VSQLTQKEFNVGAWKTVHCRETQRRVFSDNWAPDLDHGSETTIQNQKEKKKEEAKHVEGLCIVE
jgi:hypothetical protein